MPSQVLSFWEWFTIPLFSVLTVGVFVTTYITVWLTLKFIRSKLKGLCMEAMYEAGFFAGIKAQELHHYNCEACVEVMRKLRIKVNTEFGQEFIEGWKESIK